MVDMGVGEDDRVDLAGIEAECATVQRFERARSLEEAAVHEDGPIGQPQFHAGAGDGARRAVDCEG